VIDPGTTDVPATTALVTIAWFGGSKLAITAASLFIGQWIEFNIRVRVAARPWPATGHKDRKPY
jgi:hypothetical protein